MNARRDIKAALHALVTILRRRHGLAITVGLMRDLRAFGVECYELAMARMHRASTIPAPPEVAPGDETGRYLLHKENGQDDNNDDDDD
jgi:hypothetical protein